MDATIQMLEGLKGAEEQKPGEPSDKFRIIVGMLILGAAIWYFGRSRAGALGCTSCGM